MTQQLQVDPIQIFYPLGGTQSVQVYIWDGSKPILWDGSVTFSGSLPSVVSGNLTNNNAAPSTDNLGVLPAIANAVAPSWTEGNQVLLSTDLSGALRVSATIDTTGLATSAKQDTGNASLASIDTKLTAPLAVTLTSTTITGTVAVTQSGTWTVQPGNTPNTTPWLVTSGDGKTHKLKTGSTNATFTIVAAVTSKKIKVYSLSLTMTSATAVTITFKDGASGTAIGTYLLQAPTSVMAGIAESVDIPCSLFETSAGTLLEMAFSAAVSVTYNLRYWDDDAT